MNVDGKIRALTNFYRKTLWKLIKLSLILIVHDVYIIHVHFTTTRKLVSECMLFKRGYQVHLAWAGFELTTLVVIGTNYIGWKNPTTIRWRPRRPLGVFKAKRRTLIFYHGGNVDDAYSVTRPTHWAGFW